MKYIKSPHNDLFVHNSYVFIHTTPQPKIPPPTTFICKVPVMVWTFISFQSLYVEILITKVMVLGSTVSGKWLGYKSRALTIGSNAHKRDPREFPCSFYDPEGGPEQNLMLAF